MGFPLFHGHDSIPSIVKHLDNALPLLCVVGPTASGKSARAVELAKEFDGEVISVDSRQVYRMLDIGTEKTTKADMDGVPHHLIDILDPRETYSAADFVRDTTRLIKEIESRGKRPILAGGTHFYFEALIYGLPETSVPDPLVRQTLEALSTQELVARLTATDPRRAERIDLQNRRRLIRALEIVAEHGHVPERDTDTPLLSVEWVVINPERDVLRERISKRLASAFTRGLIDEVRAVREYVGDTRLNELGLEYRVIGEFLRKEREEETLLPTLSTKLWHYARHQKAWLRKLTDSN
jgi:tRNA dimethylallyltransferase